MRKRRKIRYYNGPAYAAKITQQIWFPFAATALAALVLGLVLGLILSSVSAGSRLARLPARELTELGGVEQPSEKYAPLLPLKGSMLDPSDRTESELKKAIAGSDGNAVGLVLFDGRLHYKSALSLGYEGGGLAPSTVASCAEAKSRYSVALFVSSAFGEKDTAKRAYEKGRELALLAELAQAGFREILILGLPSEEAYVSEVGLFVAQVRDFSPQTYVSVALSGTMSDAQLARLVASTETSADSFALDLRGMTREAAERAVEQNAYYLTQYNMRVLFDETAELSSTYTLNSYLISEAE
ncbi:MAG: hypothetical protein J6D16_03385 [Clostridia bacterium]|nr:hypothetical protein [Clostridia bacterium]